MAPSSLLVLGLAGLAGASQLLEGLPTHPVLTERFEFLGPVLHVQHYFETTEEPSGKALNGAILAERRLMGGAQLPLISPEDAMNLFFATPTALKENYTDLKKLGEGASGVTYLAKDKKTKQEVAVKVFQISGQLLTPGLLFRLLLLEKAGQIRAGILDQLRTECKQVENIHETTKLDAEGDKHIIECLYDGFANVEPNALDNTTPLYIVMTYGGRDLASWWEAEEDKFDVLTTSARVRKVMRDLMLGLRAMTHEGAARKWIHHDLKPGNVVVKEEPGSDVFLTIIDFGGTISDENSSTTGDWTPFFAPLDQIANVQTGASTGWTSPAYSYDMASAATTLLSITRWGSYVGAPSAAPVVLGMLSVEEFRGLQVNTVSELANCVAGLLPDFDYQHVTTSDLEDRWLPAFQKCLLMNKGGVLKSIIQGAFDKVRVAPDRREALKPFVLCDTTDGDQMVRKWTQQIVSEWVETGFDTVLLDMYHFDPARRPSPQEVLNTTWLSPDYKPKDMTQAPGMVICPALSTLIPESDRPPTTVVLITWMMLFSMALSVYGLFCRFFGKVPSPRFTSILGCVAVVSSAMSGLMWFSSPVVAWLFLAVSFVLGPALLYAGFFLSYMAGGTPSDAVVNPWNATVVAALVFCIILEVALWQSTGAVKQMLEILVALGDQVRIVDKALVSHDVMVTYGLACLSTVPPTAGIVTMLFALWRSDVHRRLNRSASSARTVTDTEGTEMQSTSA